MHESSVSLPSRSLLFFSWRHRGRIHGEADAQTAGDGESMDERRLAQEDERRWRARAAQDARLRAAEWLATDDWEDPEDRPGPSSSYPSVPDAWRDASRVPTRRNASAWEYRARQIAARHTTEVPVAFDIPSKTAALPPRPPQPPPSLPRPRRKRRQSRLRRWLVARWQAGPASRAILLAVLTALLFVCCAPGIVLVRTGLAASDGYQHLMKINALIAQEGVAALINPANQTFLQSQLAAAHADFVTLDQTLSHGRPLVQLSGGGRNIARLARLAVDLTSAGQALLAVVNSTLAPLLSNPFANHAGAALSAATLAQAHAQLATAQAQLNEAASIAPTITGEGLPSSLGPGGKLGPLLAQVGNAARISQYFGVMLDDAPSLLGVGTPATYLLLAMDRSELRTGGGFIGNYGILTVTGAHLQQTQMQDTYVLDAAYFARYHQEPPPAYPWWPYRYASTTYGWGMRDSNLSPDFPTNARAALHVVMAMQSDPQLRDPFPLVGTVAITSVVMAQIIAVGGGSLKLPEFPTHIITPQNLDDTIHCFQLGACRNEVPVLQSTDGTSTDRKRFTAFLGQTLVDRVRHFNGAQLKALMKLVFGDIASKDIQIYFTEPRAEAALVAARLGSDVPAQASDALFVTDTNIGGNKANAYVTQQEEDLVTLLPDGSALHHLLIHTSYRRQGPLYEGSTGQTSYWDYRRVYYPATATLLGAVGFANGSGRHELNETTTSDVSGRKMLGAALTIDDGSNLGECKPLPGGSIWQPWNCAAQPRDTYLYWVTPHAWSWQQGQAVYHLLVQRQAGSTVTLQVRIDASQLHVRLPAPLDARRIVQSYDLLSAQSPTGFAGQPNGVWSAFASRCIPIFNGPLSQDADLAWVGR